MTTPEDSTRSATNQERLRERLKAETLARRLADAFDVKQTDEANAKALRQVIDKELDKVRNSLAQDENQVS
ncbi:MAG: hypothetical protein H6716_24995 [Polyangiaceae bacterium]|nr:hypothetical protein [Polyangiaceae bacterium]